MNNYYNIIDDKINKQLKKQKLKIWKNNFKKVWNLSTIYENVTLCETFIIENYF